MEVMPATLLATTPFSQAPARITLSAIERTVTNIRYKKQTRASTSTKSRSVANQNHGDTPERQPRQQKNYHGNQTQSEEYRHRRRVSSLERRAEFRPLGRVSEKQLEMLMKSATDVMEEMWKDAGVLNPPKPSTAPAAPMGTQEDLQLPKIAETKSNETSSTKSPRSSPADNRKDSGNEEDLAKQRSRADGMPRVGGKVYSRVDMVKNLQKHRKSLSAPDRMKMNKTTATKSERRQRCSTSKADSVSWGDSEGMVKGKGSAKGATSTASPSGSDDDAKTKHVKSQEKLPPAKEKKRTKEKEVTVRPTKSAFVRLPRVENDHIDAEVDLSTATLEDVILAKLEEDDDNDGDNDSNSCNSKEDRVRWEGNEGGYSSDTIACTTRPTSSEADERQTTTRSEIATPELSEGALSNDEGDRCVSSAKSRRKTMKHSSAMLKDMNGNLSNKDNTYGDDIAEAIMKKLQPAHPHVIWPDNRFMTSNTVFVYGSPSQLAPVIVPSHSLDCPLCNFYKRSSSGGICPPNSPTPSLKKDYGFYPVERFYSDL